MEIDKITAALTTGIEHAADPKLILLKNAIRLMDQYNSQPESISYLYSMIHQKIDDFSIAKMYGKARLQAAKSYFDHQLQKFDASLSMDLVKFQDQLRANLSSSKMKLLSNLARDLSNFKKEIDELEHLPEDASNALLSSVMDNFKHTVSQINRAYLDIR